MHGLAWALRARVCGGVNPLFFNVFDHIHRLCVQQYTLCNGCFGNPEPALCLPRPKGPAHPLAYADGGGLASAGGASLAMKACVQSPLNPALQRGMRQLVLYRMVVLIIRALP